MQRPHEEKASKLTLRDLVLCGSGRSASRSGNTYRDIEWHYKKSAEVIVRGNLILAEMQEDYKKGRTE